MSMKSENSPVILRYLLILLIQATIVTAAKTEPTKLEGDYLISLIGKKIDYPEIKTLLKDRTYKFKKVKDTGIYQSLNMGIDLQFRRNGVLSSVTLYNQDENRQPFTGNLPGNNTFQHILYQGKFEWRPISEFPWKPEYEEIRANYKDVHLVIKCNRDQTIRYLRIEMQAQNYNKMRAPGETAPEWEEQAYPSDHYQGDFFCELIGKSVADPVIKAFLSDKSFNFIYRKYNNSYLSPDHGILIYLKDDSTISTIYLRNDYEYGALYKGLLPGNTTFKSILKTKGFLWFEEGKSRRTLYQNCRVTVNLYDNGQVISVGIDGYIQELQKFLAEEEILSKIVYEGDTWIDLMGRNIDDPKVQRLIKNPEYKFKQLRMGAWGSETKGITLYATKKNYIGSITLYNAYSGHVPYTGLLPGGLTFANIFNHDQIQFQQSGNSHKARYKDYGLLVWSDDGKVPAYLTIESDYPKTYAKNFDGQLTGENIYDEQIIAENTNSGSSVKEIHKVTDALIAQFRSDGWNYINKHSVRQVGGGDYYSTKCDWMMLSGSRYHFIIIYTSEGVKNSKIFLKAYTGETLHLTPTLSYNLGDFTVEGVTGATVNQGNVTIDVTLFFSDQHQSKQVYKDLDVLIFRMGK